MSDSRVCEDKGGLLDYLYGEGDDPHRVRFERHLVTCTACRQEVDELRGVRRQMASWTPPDAAIEIDIGPVGTMARAGRRGAIARWGLAAAAVLVLAAGAAVANVQVTAGPDGLSIRTGWASAERGTAASTANTAEGSQPAPWHADLAALESRLRRDIQTTATTPAADSTFAIDRAAMDRRVRALIAESEARQQRELALRMAQLTSEVEVQRRADLVRIEQGFGVLEGTAGAEAAQQRELLNYLVRVSQQR